MASKQQELIPFGSGQGPIQALADSVDGPQRAIFPRWPHKEGRGTESSPGLLSKAINPVCEVSTLVTQSVPSPRLLPPPNTIALGIRFHMKLGAGQGGLELFSLK